MKKLLLILSIVFLISQSYAQNWIRKSSLPGSSGSFKPVSFVINGKLYVGGGWDGSNADSAFYEYEPSTNTWTAKGAMPPLYTAATFVINGKAYVACGANPGLTNTIFMYDPTQDVWTRKNDFPGHVRQNCAGFALNNKGYLFAGFIGGSTTINDVWEYDPTADSWVQKSNLPGPGRNNPAYFVINNEAYMGAGGSGNATTVYADFYKYDPVRDTFSRIADIPVARSCAANFSIDSFGYVGLGLMDLNTFFNDFYAYNPRTNTWTQKSNFGGGLRYHTFSETIGNIPYIGNGISSSGYLQDMWSYAPSAINDLGRETSEELRCYPIPAVHGAFTVDLSALGATIKEINIYNQLGQVVFKTTCSELKTTLNPNLSDGIYMISVISGNLQKSTKIIIN